MITIDGVQIADPSSLDIGIFRITKSERVASGLMMMEIIATKRKLELEWSKIKESDLKTILDLLDTKVFHTVTYPDPQGADGQKTITAYVGDIAEKAWYYVGGVRYWENVKISLIER